MLFTFCPWTFLDDFAKQESGMELLHDNNNDGMEEVKQHEGQNKQCMADGQWARDMTLSSNWLLPNVLHGESVSSSAGWAVPFKKTIWESWAKISFFIMMLHKRVMERTSDALTINLSNAGLASTKNGYTTSLLVNRPSTPARNRPCKIYHSGLYHKCCHLVSIDISIIAPQLLLSSI